MGGLTRHVLQQHLAGFSARLRRQAVRMAGARNGLLGAVCFVLALPATPEALAWDSVDSTRVSSRSSHRRGAEWEVQIIQQNGRRQVYRGLREKTRDARVLKLHAIGDADVSTGPPRVSQLESRSDSRADLRSDRGQTVERIEGGFVAPARGARSRYGYR